MAKQPMEEEPTKHLRLDIVRRQGTLVGQVGVDGECSKPFTGWIALNAAIDDLLGDEGGGRRPPAP